MTAGSNESSLRSELRSATVALSSRCLTNSARWCAELLASLDLDETEGNTDGVTADSSGDENDRIRLARLYLESKEFRRSAHCLEKCRLPKGKFLRWYALYLAGEKQREETFLEGEDKSVNEELSSLRAELVDCRRRRELDAFGLYLLGVIFKALNLNKDAAEALCESLRLFPVHWGAWQELASLLSDREEVELMSLPDHWMQEFFLAHVDLEFQESESANAKFVKLQKSFPDSTFIKSQEALALYHARDFDNAQVVFEDVLDKDPYRLEGIDTFSNILYVKEQQANLSELARKCVKIDKYRPETCCVIGNYLSIRRQHVKAVQYFHRALRLNRLYLSAWTLMGHEYVEMKNTSAAVEAYRNAVDINPRDYRAWYGLGQTYELLNMPLYTLYYFRKAAALRPRDARMWCAMGHCYEEIGQNEEAAACYERGVQCDLKEGSVLNRLAGLYKRLGESQKAAKSYREIVRRAEVDGDISNPDISEALLFLAEFEMNEGRLDEATSFCEMLLDIPGLERVRASSLLKKIQSKSS